MTLLQLSVRALPMVLLFAACTGKRTDPSEAQPAEVFSPTGGGGTTGSGASGTGATGAGAGGTGSGAGGMGTGAGGPGSGAGGAGSGAGGASTTGPGTGGGMTANDVSDIYPYCGCLDDAQEAGSCAACFGDPMTSSDCLPPVKPFAVCAAGCTAIISFLQTSPQCVQVDEACLQAAYNIAPEEWDDAVDQVSCKCGECPAPFGCDSINCNAL